MAERLCIDKSVISESGGRATCPARFTPNRENLCGGCPKLNFNGSRGTNRDGRSKVDRVVDLYFMARDGKNIV